MSEEDDANEEKPVSIASLKSRFENLAAANTAPNGSNRPVRQAPPSAPKPAWTRPPATAKATVDRDIVAVKADPPTQTAATISNTSSSNTSEVVRPSSTQETESIIRQDADEPALSVKDLRSRFNSSTAAPSAHVPRISTPMLSRTPSAGSIREVSGQSAQSTEIPKDTPTDVLSSSPAADEVLLNRKKPAPPPPVPRARTPLAQAPAQQEKPTRPAISRPAPALPPSRQPIVALEPPTPSESTASSAAGPSRPIVPALPVRKPTLPASGSSVAAPSKTGSPQLNRPLMARSPSSTHMSLTDSPPLPARRASAGSTHSSLGAVESPLLPPRRPSAASIESPPLPARSRAPSLPSQASAPVATPPRLPNRAGTISSGGNPPLPARSAAPPPVSVSQPSQSLPPRPQASGITPTARQARETTPVADASWQAPPPPSRNPNAPTSTPPKRAETRMSTKSGTASTDEEDEDEKDGNAGLTSTAKRMLDEYPDSTNANKRPPTYSPDIRVRAGHQINSFAAFGRYMCIGAHHVRVFDVQMSDRPLFTVDLHQTGLEFRIKDPKVTALCFRPAFDEADEGRYLWCGTKDGHMWELDIKTGSVTDTRSYAHGSAVTHIFRWKKHILSLEENGKLHLYDLQQLRDTSVSRIPEICRTTRVADRFTFARMLRHQLWTSSGPANRSTTNTTLSKGPTIRVYEPTFEGALPPPATLYTTEWTGAVITASALPLKPEEVFLGHEGGYVSIWNAVDLTCLSVLKISGTDILSMEGVGHKLWLGNRKGQVGVYDVSQTPWVATNLWTAHPEQSVSQLYVDPYAIEHADRFTCWSVARDNVHAWDGLLAVDWVDRQLEERQVDFCSFREIKVLVCTWNIDSAKPTDLNGSEANAGFLDELLSSVDSPDIVVFGFQEVIPLTDKKLTAKTLLFGKERGASGALSDKVSMAYLQWQDKLQQGCRRNAPPGDGYARVYSESLVGLLTCAFVKQSQHDTLRDVAITTVKRGIGGIYGNKGAIVARLVVEDTSICFINVHLAAGQSQRASRNADIAAIMEDKAIFPASDPLPYVHGGDGSGIMDHEIVVINGDMNYRIDQRRDNVIASINDNDFAYLLEHDQLRKELRSNRAFRLRTFDEAPITFAPTYKYDRRSDEYDSSEKRRVPAWCDRILFSKSDKIECLDYRRYETDVSDHRPVSAALQVRLKAVDQARRRRVRDELMLEWAKEESELMDSLLRAFQDWGRV